MANLGQSSVLLRYRTGSNRSECIADSYVHDSQTCPACSSIRSTDDECRACSPCSRGSSAASVCAECRTASGAPSHRSPNRCRASPCRLLSLFSFVQFVFKKTKRGIPSGNVSLSELFVMSYVRRFSGARSCKPGSMMSTVMPRASATC